MQLIKLKLFGAAKRADMAKIEQIKKIIPIITREIPFGQDVCELVFGVDVFDLDFGVRINSIEQPIKSNSVGSGNMSHCWTSTFDSHLKYCLIVLKDTQHGTVTRMHCVGRNVVNVSWNDVGVLELDEVRVWLGSLQRVSP